MFELNLQPAMSKEDLFKELFNYSTKIIMIGEEHYVDKYVSNDCIILDEFAKRKMPYTLYVEHLSPGLLNHVPKTEEGRKRLIDLVTGKVPETDFYKEMGAGKRYFLPVLIRAFDNGTLKSFGFNGESIGLGSAKTERLAGILNDSCNNTGITVAICGSNHVVKDRIRDKLSALVKGGYREIIQDKKYAEKVVKENSFRFGLDARL